VDVHPLLPFEVKEGFGISSQLRSDLMIILWASLTYGEQGVLIGIVIQFTHHQQL